MTKMIKTIVLASNNQGKLLEFKALFSELSITIIPQSSFNITTIEETGFTFVENAILKARHASKISGLPAIADDSGIIVDALDGSPGVNSHRYACENKEFKTHFQRLLYDLKDVPIEKRTARYHAVIVFLQSPKDPMPLIGQGTLEGVILSAPAGNGGFGHDPVFYLPHLKKTVAELSNEEKNQLSHRGQAARQLISMLQTHYSLTTNTATK